MLDLILPKNFVSVLAGMVNLVFERLSGSHNGVMVEKIASQPDDLTLINGIGPTFATRLQAAGIDSFQKLATAEPAQVKEAAKLADWQADPVDWIAEAKTLVA